METFYKRHALYDITQDNGQGGAKIVAQSDTKEDLETLKGILERQDLRRIAALLENAEPGRLTDLKIYWYILALGGTRYYIA